MRRSLLLMGLMAVCLIAYLARHPQAEEFPPLDVQPSPIPSSNTQKGRPTQSRPASPTGDPKLDEAYRDDPQWRKRWDRYRTEFANAQMRHNQPPPPPDPPWVENERLKYSGSPPTGHFSPNR